VKVDDPCRCDCPDACPDETYTQDQSTCECIAPAKEEEEESGYKAKFTYHENGADWEDLNENLCQTGREQSPIDFGEV
jgi:carbonic anhydrase